MFFPFKAHSIGAHEFHFLMIDPARVKGIFHFFVEHHNTQYNLIVVAAFSFVCKIHLNISCSPRAVLPLDVAVFVYRSIVIPFKLYFWLVFRNESGSIIHHRTIATPAASDTNSLRHSKSRAQWHIPGLNE